MLLGEDKIGNEVKWNGNSVWVNEKMLFSMIMGTLIALEMVTETEFNNMAMAIAESVYEQITSESEPTGPAESTDSTKE